MASSPSQRHAVYYTTGQVARYCLVSPDTVLGWLRAGSLRGQRTPGGQYRVLLEDLLTFMRAHEMRTDLVLEELDVRPFCWEFHCAGSGRSGCCDCVVYRSGARKCVPLADHVERSRAPNPSCDDCEYRRRFLEAPRKEDSHG